MSVFREFREFAARGDETGLAIGAALGKIAASFANSIPALPANKPK